MRDVARGAGVDVALVSRYFGSKQELFRKVLLERAGQDWFGGCTDLEDLADWLAELAVGTNGDLDDIERLSIILRSASSQVTAMLVRTAFVDDVFAPLVQMLGHDGGEQRARLALGIVIGSTVLRSILDVTQPGDGAREVEREQLRSLIFGALASGAGNPECRDR